MRNIFGILKVVSNRRWSLMRGLFTRDFTVVCILIKMFDHFQDEIDKYHCRGGHLEDYKVFDGPMDRFRLVPHNQVKIIFGK